MDWDWLRNIEALQAVQRGSYVVDSENTVAVIDDEDALTPRLLLARKSTAYFIFSFLIFLTFATWLTVRDSEENIAGGQFNNSADTVVYELRNRISSYERTLRAAAVIYESAGENAPGRWKRFVKSLDIEKRMAASSGVGFVKSVGNYSAGDYSLWVNNAANGFFKMFDEESNNEDMAMIYVEPIALDEHQGVQGYMAIGAKSRAMFAARDSGQLTMSDMAVNISFPDNTVDNAFYLFYPVYEKELDSDASIDERRKFIHGFVFTAFKPSSLLRVIRDDLDRSVVSQAYASKGFTNIGEMIYGEIPGNYKPMYQRTFLVDLAGKTWQIKILSAPSFNSNLYSKNQIIILLVGLAFSLASLCVLLIIVNNRKKINDLSLAIRRSRDNYRKLVDNVPGIVFRVDVSVRPWKIVMINNHVDKVFGLSRHEAMNDLRFAGMDIIFSKDRSRVISTRLTAIQSHQQYSIEYRIQREDGDVRWISERGQASNNEKTGRWDFLDGVCVDVTDRKLADEAHRRMAFYDALTDLPNRRLLHDRIEHYLAITERNSKWGALLFVDMDNFKIINNTMGHRAGDQLLKSVAQRMLSCVRSIDTVARIGGDEFVTLLENSGDTAEEAISSARSVARQMLNELDAPFMLDGGAAKSTPSIGIAIFSGTSDPVDELLRRADEAMYYAKSSGKNCYFVWGSEVNPGVDSRQIRLPIEYPQIEEVSSELQPG